ncbi:hypothetical protein HPB51_020795 [Rhipicephalus microplus]|uniref:Uncharacterized protein n=1 Tax=Rhipicephalus microplus TaxID=6941 RepID=A0A9J6DP64_RHIMP|nr:hypothetical protein HPB51_020795 [Rhipicephalus microplus]
MEEGTTPPPPKRRAETQANEGKPAHVTPENKVLKEVQQSVKELNEWMSNASRLISALTDRVETIDKITQQQNEHLQQRLIAVEARITPLPPSGLDPTANVKQPSFTRHGNASTTEALVDYTLNVFNIPSFVKSFLRGRLNVNSVEDLARKFPLVVSTCATLRVATAAVEGYHYLIDSNVSSGSLQPPLGIQQVAQFASNG